MQLLLIFFSAQDPVSEYSLSVASESPAALQPPAFISTDSGVSLGSTSTTTLVLSHPSESREEVGT